MKSSVLKALVACAAFSCAVVAIPVVETLAPSEPGPAGYIRHEAPAPAPEPATTEPPAAAAPYGTSIPLPPPLTVAYQDKCNPCCVNCVTYSDLHVDTDCDECCKPAAVIKTHHFIKEINYKCCTNPCGDAAAATTTSPAAAMSLAAMSLAAMSLAAASPAAMSPAAASPAATSLAAIMTAAITTAAAVSVTMVLSSTATVMTNAAATRTAAVSITTAAITMMTVASTTTTAVSTTTIAATTMMTAAIAMMTAATTTMTTAAASATAAARSCIKDPCGNHCVETHHCYAPNTCPCPCKENLSTECCITHCIIEPPCGCCGCCGCCCNKGDDGFGPHCGGNHCPTPNCTPSFSGSHLPDPIPAPCTAPVCPTLADTAPNCPSCAPDYHGNGHH
ncbi:hypothetical protein GGI07_004531 [Coemansia sp. Benny D115]|nr:hypothetical protein GGI07_004531 [Coemansia sp. Benny D115]